MNNAKFQVRALSSLTKVFADEELKAKPYRQASCLLGEVFSFQVAYRSTEWLDNIGVEIDTKLAANIVVRAVGLAPAQFLGRFFDENVLRTTPGLYPDPLYPVSDDLKALPGQWRAVWITVRVPRRGVTGKQRLDIRLVQRAKTLGNVLFNLEIIPVLLPAQKLIHTSWFHADCIFTHYGVNVWSKAHWDLLRKYMYSAADHGINLLLTPLFTPPLDTQVGGERPTVQLIEVKKTGNEYDFGFKRLQQWIKLGTEAGIKYFEMSHLFTQWGAAHCPKIIASENGRERKIFGWKDSASGEKYKNFLNQFLPALVAFIKRQGIQRRCFFHVSDEPHVDHIESFAKAAAIIHKHLSEFKCIDALSDLDYYEKGLVQIPIPASNHLEPFVEKGIKGLWTYYCVSQWDRVANRFFCMPSARNRILGTQLFKYNLAGFLHWGFNFWYTQDSTRSLDPFKETDAGGAFPAGDAFMVYPGPEGPLDSIRGEVFREALQDQRALQLLEKLQGREKTIALVEEGTERAITMKEYPRDEAWLLQMRNRCNRRIAKLIQR